MYIRVHIHLLLLLIVCASASQLAAQPLDPIPDKLVVLTFDDAVKSHFTIVRPLLKKYQFTATFFVTEGFDFATNKQDYMTWDEIAQLHRDGFEIGNHTRDHLSITDENAGQLTEQLDGIAKKCEEHSIPRPISFAWPGNSLSTKALEALAEHGILFARRGGVPEYDYESGKGWAYEPGLDHPLLIPSAGDARPDWELEDFERAVSQARFGRIAVIQFHGVPDRAHPWVHTAPERFELFLRYLAENDYRVIAMRDLTRYVDPSLVPNDPSMVIQDRQRILQQDSSVNNFRTPTSDNELRFWLSNMLVDHRFTLTEAAAATGLAPHDIQRYAQRLNVYDEPATRTTHGAVRVLPFPGGRHPRIGFRDGAIRPQRETKLSIFLPWEKHAYIVADVPEAIWWDTPHGRELLYLAHTHVPTTWDLQNITLQPLEWQATAEGWEIERELPNGVKFGARATARVAEVNLELWIENGSDQTLKGLVVQNCVMLGQAIEFDPLTNDNKVFSMPYAACGDAERRRWIITGWENCIRPWGNPPCPCMHADPQFPDCPPGERRTLRGVVAFYEGPDINAELDRRHQLGWPP